MNLRIKGGQRYKKINSPVIILSNYSPHKAFQKALLKNDEALDSFLTRLEVIEIPQWTKLDLKGFREALAQATLATTLLHLSPLISYSDLDLTNRLSELETLESNSKSPQSSPVLQRSKRLRSELVQSTESTNYYPESESSSPTTALAVSESLLDQATSSIAPVALATEEVCYKKFKKFRRNLDDFE